MSDVPPEREPRMLPHIVSDQDLDWSLGDDTYEDTVFVRCTIDGPAVIVGDGIWVTHNVFRSDPDPPADIPRITLTRCDVTRCDLRNVYLGFLHGQMGRTVE